MCTRKLIYVNTSLLSLVNTYISYIDNTQTLKEKFADRINIWSDPGIEPETSGSRIRYHCAPEAVNFRNQIKFHKKISIPS